MDGGHTLAAVLEAQKDGMIEWPAYVFVKVVAGVDSDQIAEIAGGLNTSQQVDLKSLETLRNHFVSLEKVLEKEPYFGDISFRMNEDKPIDVREILYYLAMFDCDQYTEKVHPVSLFGRKERVVREFASQMAGKSQFSSFTKLVSKAPEILNLRDLIEKKTLDQDIGRFKAGKGDVRVRSQRNKQNHLWFLNEKVDGKISLGWIMPMLAAFRANVDWNKPKNSFSWIVPLDQLLEACIEQLVLGITEHHVSENSRPEYVGRNAMAWRMSYNAVSKAILEIQLKQARGGKS